MLLGAAEWLHRHEGPPLVGPFRVDQAPSGLAAGGTAILFGAAYGAGPFLGLLPPLLAFAAMACAALVALAAALRYGPLTAATGIVGAFATPALVATDTPSLPGLFVYLLLVSAAALWVVRRTAWTWLGWATTIAGAIWVCFAAVSDAADPWAAAAFVPAAAALHLLLLPGAALDHPVGRRLAWVPFACSRRGRAGAGGSRPRRCRTGRAVSAVAGRGLEGCRRKPRLDRLPWVAALIGLLTLLVWPLPTWTSTAEVIRIEGVVQAILPGAWAPQALLPFLSAAAVLAGFHAGAGLWLERRAPGRLAWAALVAAVPVLALAVTYARVRHFQTDAAWAGAALALTAALTFTAAAAAREGDRQRAGVHAAGAVAALALGCAMLLQDYWLTLAVALFLPPLAWIEARADLPPLRRVALATAALVIVRLVLNWYVLDYTFGDAAARQRTGCQATRPRQLRSRSPPCCSAGAAMTCWSPRWRRAPSTFLAVFAALEIRHWSGDGRLEADHRLHRGRVAPADDGNSGDSVSVSRPAYRAGGAGLGVAGAWRHSARLGDRGCCAEPDGDRRLGERADPAGGVSCAVRPCRAGAEAGAGAGGSGWAWGRTPWSLASPGSRCR